ncbi:MAG: hypothetical protein ACPHV3_08310, partial [Vibrio sp.]
TFWVGLVTGIMLPILVVVFMLYLTVSQLTGFVSQEAIAPLLKRGEITLDNVDHLIATIDDKASNAELENIHLLAPFQDAKLLPELKKVTQGAQEIREAVEGFDKEAIKNRLKQEIQQSLTEKLPADQAQTMADSLVALAEVLAQNQAPVQDSDSK